MFLATTRLYGAGQEICRGPREATDALSDLTVARVHLRTQLDIARSAPANYSKVERFSFHCLVGPQGETVGISLFSRHNLFVAPIRVISRQLLFRQGDFSNDQWKKIGLFFGHQGGQVAINLSRLESDVIDNVWFDDFVERVMRGGRHAIYA